MKLACAGNCANTEDVEKIKERRLILSISWKFFQKMLLMFWGLKGILQVEKKWKYKMGRECNKWKGSNMVFLKNLSHLWSCCCSVAQLSQTFCNPMNRSTPVFPVLHHLLEFAQIHVHWVSDADAIYPSHPLPLSSPFAFNLSQHWVTKSQTWLSDFTFPSIKVFSDELALRIRWPKYRKFQHQSFQWIFMVDFL